MKVYVILYEHRLFDIREVSAVYLDRNRAERYIENKETMNECMHCGWKLHEKEVIE